MQIRTEWRRESFSISLCFYPATLWDFKSDSKFDSCFLELTTAIKAALDFGEEYLILNTQFRGGKMDPCQIYFAWEKMHLDTTALFPSFINSNKQCSVKK